MPLDILTRFVEVIEGPYKWFILIGVAISLSAFFTRFVFKTLKWVIIVVILIVISWFVIQYLK